MTAVVAHRTCPRDAPENSLAGIATAAAAGADVVEVDVRRARDGIPVLVHDALALRVQRIPLPVRCTPRGWLTRRGVPTFEAAMVAAREHGMQVAIDTKDAGAAPAVVEVLRRTGTVGVAWPWSQHEAAVRHYAAALPGTPVALLRDTFDEAAHERLLADALRFGAGFVSVHQDAVTPDFVRRAAARGLGVHCWYQDEALQAQRLPAVAAAGLASVVTDWPTAARALLA